MNPVKKNKTYGMWGSPVSAVMLSQRLRLEDVRWDSDGFSVVWLEGRSGKGVLVTRPEEGARLDLTVEQNVHAGVGYGGGDFSISKGVVYFVDRSGCICKHGLGYGQPRPITPAYGHAASPTLSPDGKWVVYVFSDGRMDLLGMVDAEGRDWPIKLVRGADFYMQPAWHPSGNALSWVEWDHPNMPWDGSRLKVGRLAGDPLRLVDELLVAGDGNTPTMQPAFSPDGHWLSYIIGNGEWEDLVIHNLEDGSKHVLVKGEKFHLSLPAWVQGFSSYGWNSTGESIFYTQYYGGYSSVWQLNLESGISKQLDTSPYTWIRQLSVSHVADQLVFIASAPGIPDRVVRWDGKQMEVVCHSETESVPPEMFSSPKQVRWKADNGSYVNGLYYPPCNNEYEGEGLPPAIISVHGGPTSSNNASYDPERAYYTTRGYAWLEVNYRGSSGYGRSYQDALGGHWGEYDTQDVVDGANYLAVEKLADPGKIVILGSSAGGYTVLNALVQHPGIFKAGVCKYGVSNLFTLAMDTHKFEEHYLDSLVGPLPGAADKYQRWSPQLHAGNICTPLAIFQGMEDRVVPPAQSEAIVDALRRKGVPYIYRLYEGEGHGFRKSENIADYLIQTERFLQQHVLFSV